MEIKKEFENKLLKRKEVEVTLVSEKNPGNVEVIKNIIEKFKTTADNITVKSIKNRFGSHEFLIEAFIYDSKSDKDRIEPRKKQKKVAGK